MKGIQSYIEVLVRAFARLSMTPPTDIRGVARCRREMEDAHKRLVGKFGGITDVSSEKFWYDVRVRAARFLAAKKV